MFKQNQLVCLQTPTMPSVFTQKRSPMLRLANLKPSQDKSRKLLASRGDPVFRVLSDSIPPQLEALNSRNQSKGASRFSFSVASANEHILRHIRSLSKPHLFSLKNTPRIQTNPFKNWVFDPPHVKGERSRNSATKPKRVRKSGRASQTPAPPAKTKKIRKDEEQAIDRDLVVRRHHLRP